MNTSSLAKGLAVSRIVFGVGFMLKPKQTARGWIGPRSARSAGAQVLTRALGARDLALGVGTLFALSGSDDSVRTWLAAHTLSDGTDFVATLVADDLPPASRAFGLVMAGGSAAIGLAYLATPSKTLSPT